MSSSGTADARSSAGCGVGVGAGAAVVPPPTTTGAAKGVAETTAPAIVPVETHSDTKAGSILAEPSVYARDDDPAAGKVPDLDHFDYDDFKRFYEPSDDTFLFLDCLVGQRSFLEALRPTLCVELGPGSGTISTFLSSMFAARWKPVVLAVDINAEACKASLATSRVNKQTRVEPVVSDLAQGIRLKGNVDVLLFNPPYVPTPSSEVGTRDIVASWAGGERGREVIDRLLPLVKDMLSPNGVMYLLLVRDNDPDEVAEMLTSYGLRCQVIVKRRAMNERLCILRAQLVCRDTA